MNNLKKRHRNVALMEAAEPPTPAALLVFDKSPASLANVETMFPDPPVSQVVQSWLAMPESQFLVAGSTGTGNVICAGATDEEALLDGVLTEVIEALPREHLGRSTCTAVDAELHRKVDERWNDLVRKALAH